MKLLDAQKISEDKKKRDEQRFLYIQKLHKEENEITQRINEIKDKEKKIMCEIDAHLTDARINADNEIRKIQREVDEMYVKVERLEARRKNAIKPLEEIRKEIEEDRLSVSNQQIELDKKLKEVKEDRQLLLDRMENITERELTLSEKHEEADARLACIQNEEDTLKESQNTLIKEWAKFNESVVAAQKQFAEQEAEIKSERLILDEMNSRNQEEQVRLKNEERRIKDLYIALQEAQRHIYGKRKKR